MAAGDVAGVQWSTNGGLTWAPHNDGLAQGQTPIAAIGWGATETTRAWIAYGRKDDNGECSVCGLATATVNDGTLTPWNTLGRGGTSQTQCALDGKIDATTLRFQGMKGTGDQTADPGGRAVGSLVVDDGGGRLFAGTLDGLYVSTANDTYGFALGDCWMPVWASGDGHVIRSLIQDPTAADTFFVGTNDTGVWRITYHSDGSPPDVKQFSATPPPPRSSRSTWPGPSCTVRAGRTGCGDPPTLGAPTPP